MMNGGYNSFINQNYFEFYFVEENLSYRSNLKNWIQYERLFIAYDTMQLLFSSPYFNL